MKKKPRKYFSGGDIASILPMVADLAGNYINAATYEFDPKGPAYKADWTKGISQGVVGVIPELIKQQKDSKKRSAYVASATPGSYQQGGPIQPTPRPVSRGVRPQGYSVYTDIPVVTPQRPVVDPFNPFPVVQPPTILPVRIPSGGSSKSKSKDRYREMATGGPILEVTDFQDPRYKKYKKELAEQDRKRAHNAKYFADYDKSEPDPIMRAGFRRYMDDIITGVNKDVWKGYKGTVDSPGERDVYDSKGKLKTTSTLDRMGVYQLNNITPVKLKYNTDNLPISSKPSAKILPELQIAHNLERNGQLTPLTKKAYEYITNDGVITQEFTRPTRLRPNTKVLQYATGGRIDDSQLSNNSFQVNYNSNETDAKHYPEFNANLDKNEVVKDNFVYSTKLKTPAGKPFSFEAAKLEKSTGKAQKILMSNPSDQMAKNTIMMNESSMSSLAKLQETMATAMGHRDAPAQGMATGGFYDDGGPGDPPYTFVGLTNNKEFPVANLTGKEWLDFTNPYDPAKGARRRPVTPDTFTGVKFAPNQAAIDLGRDGMYYNPYDRTFSVRNSRGEYVSVTPNPGQFDVSGDNIKDLIGNKSYNVAEHLRYMQSPKAESAGPSGPTLETPSNVLTNPSETIEELGAFPYPVTTPNPVTAPVTDTPRGTGSRGRSKPSTPSKPLTPWDKLYAGVSKNKPAPYDPNAMPSEADVLAQLGPATNATRADDRLSRLGPLQAPTEDSKSMSMDAVTPGAVPRNIFAGTDPQFTVGDGLQALTVLSKFGQLQGGAEVERPYYDTTSITKENFDPSNALAQSNRNFQTGLNTLQNSSINQNRSFLNKLQVNKLTQDSDILTKYNQMNQSARTQYEARTADQRRYNIGQTVGTNDLNARNRAAYKEAVDVALNSVGNYGKALNEKRTAYDSLAVLQKMFPDVYARIMAEQQKTPK